MKTHIIQLEQYDDLISVRDKMSWAKSERILLVWPPRRKVNIRPLDMVLLQRHAIFLGTQLGIATRSGDIRRSALETGIPVFRTSSEAQLASWNAALRISRSLKGKHRRYSPSKLKEMRADLSDEETDWTRNPYFRIGIFTAGALAVLVFFILFLPSATIRLNPITQSQSVTIPVVIDPKTTSVNISGRVPAYPITVTLVGDGTIPATGKIKLPEIRASGSVQFSNLTESTVRIPEGTIIRSVAEPAVRFFVTKSGEIPGGVGEKLVLPVRAVEGGFDGNLSADTLQSIEGTLGLSLSVTNPVTTAGGGDVEKTIATMEDRSDLFGEISNSLTNKAVEGARKQLPQGGFLIPGATVSEIVSEIYDPPQGSPGPTLSLELKQNYTTYYIKGEDLQALGNLVLDASVPEDFVPITDSLSVEPVGEPLVESDGRLTWQVLANRSVSARLDQLDVIFKALAKSPTTAINNLSKLMIVSSPQITMSPTWWPWMPFLPMRISVEGVQ
jgi:hypothetical protein